MNTLNSLCAAVLLGLGAGAQAQTAPPVTPVQDPPPAEAPLVQPVPVLPDDAALSDAKDRAFLQDALRAGQIELSAAESVASRSNNVDVKALADAVEAHYAGLNARLQEIHDALPAPESPIAAPPPVSADPSLARLGALAGKDFETAYVDMQIANHRAAISRFSEAMLMEQGHGDAVRTAVAAPLPALRDNLEKAVALRAELP